SRVQSLLPLAHGHLPELEVVDPPQRGRRVSLGGYQVGGVAGRSGVLRRFAVGGKSGSGIGRIVQGCRRQRAQEGWRVRVPEGGFPISTARGQLRIRLHSTSHLVASV